MIEMVRDQGAQLGKAAATAVSSQPEITVELDRLAVGITEQFAELMKQAGFVDEDIQMLCRNLREAYRAELPADHDATKH